MSNAEAAVMAFAQAWQISSDAERVALLAKHAIGKLAAALGPDAHHALPNNPAFAPLFTHGFKVANVATIGEAARAHLVVTSQQTVTYVLSLKATANGWGFTGLQLERTDF